jgi:hypothetical protein
MIPRASTARAAAARMQVDTLHPPARVQFVSILVSFDELKALNERSNAVV